MEKELFIKDRHQNSIVIQHDDLKFDGKHIIIPSYWTDSILDALLKINPNELNVDIREDFDAFKNFLIDVQEYKNQGN
jgi:hypothetical protein